MQIPNKKAKQNKSRCERRAGNRSSRKWRFEQLESRAMLSATIGPTMGPPVPMVSFEIQSYQETYVAQAGIFAPHELEMRLDMAPAWNASPIGPMRGGHHDEHAMFGGPFGQDAWGYNPAPIQHSSLTSQNKPAEPPVPPPINHGEVEYLYSFSVGYFIAPNNYEAATTPKTQLPPVHQQQGTLPGAANNRILDDTGPAASYGYGNGTNTKAPQHDESRISYDYIVSRISNQSTGHESDATNYISSGVADAALQTYPAPLQFPTISPSNQPTIAIALSDSATGDLNDDFVRLGDGADAADAVSSSDALSREQAAIEEVLESLQGVDSLPGQVGDSAIANDNSTSAEQDAQATDLAFASAFDLANADGGMLLLQVRSDASEAPINLANVAESHPDMFTPHPGVEVSVGFYQAIDRGVEEFTAAESSAVATPTVTPVQASKPGNRLTTSRETSGRKAAAVVTASTLAGALLWCAAHKRGDDDRDTNSLR